MNSWNRVRKDVVQSEKECVCVCVCGCNRKHCGKDRGGICSYSKNGRTQVVKTTNLRILT
jgi:hypothetical protein